MENSKKIALLVLFLFLFISLNAKMEKNNLFPVKNHKITSGYGWRTLQGLGRHFHYGLDIISNDFNIYAPADSTVVFAAPNGTAGNQINLQKDDLIFEFMHLAKIFVEVGQKVKRGDVIGIMGTTGLSTGVHLHFGVKKNNIYINPLELIYKYE